MARLLWPTVVLKGSAMKLTLNWLKEHLDTSASLEEIAQALTQLGLEVESIEDPAERLQGFVVADVVKTERHPNADRLTLCQIDDGTGTLLQVVCGAQNVRSPMKVAFARVGTVIPVTGAALKPGVIRGISSQGMLCSAEELLLSSSSDGILDLDTTYPAGTALAQALDLDDCVIDLSITPNRSDCFSVRGLARDLAAFGIGTLKPLPEVSFTENRPCSLPVFIQDPACCYFSGRIIENLHNGESPAWLKKRLQAVGQRSISAIVDITNYVCLDRGQPLHAFDADKIQGNLVIRPAKEGETFLALNEQTYSLSSGMTTVADDKGVLSLTGIMGGKNSACSIDTTRIFLESAYFDSVRIAKTGQTLNITTDSRTRFERGVDPEQVKAGLDYATYLITEICGGQISQTVEVGTLPSSHAPITLTLSKMLAVSGCNDLTLTEAGTLLKKLGLEIISETSESLTAVPPRWRHDLNQDVDLIEEILRLKGYDRIPVTSLPFQFLNTIPSRTTLIQRSLTQRGLDEIYSWSFIDSQTADLLGDGIPLAVPLSQDMAVLRPSVLSGLLKAVVYNQNKSQKNSAFFELAHIFQNQNSHPIEEATVAGVRGQNFVSRHWSETERGVDVFDVKADAEVILQCLNVQKYQIEALGPDYYHPTRKGALKQGPKILGYFGEIHPQVLSYFKIEGPVVGFEIFIDRLPAFLQKRSLPPLKTSPYQAVVRDFAFIVPNDVSADHILKTIEKADKTLVQHLQIFDVYTGDKLEVGKKSIGLEVRLQAYDRTLTEDDLNLFSQKVIELVQRHCHGILRSGL